MENQNHFLELEGRLWSQKFLSSMTTMFTLCLVPLLIACAANSLASMLAQGGPLLFVGFLSHDMMIRGMLNLLWMKAHASPGVTTSQSALVARIRNLSPGFRFTATTSGSGTATVALNFELPVY